MSRDKNPRLEKYIAQLSENLGRTAGAAPAGYRPTDIIHGTSRDSSSLMKLVSVFLRPSLLYYTDG